MRHRRLGVGRGRLAKYAGDVEVLRARAAEVGPRGHCLTEIRGDGCPTWMCAPDVEPGTAPQEAMKGMPAARRYSISACPSGLSGCTATSSASLWSRPMRSCNGVWP